MKPSFEGSEFAENFKGEEFDRWYDDFQEDELIPLLNQRALPGETYALDETEENPLLPDYTVTEEDMHDYGYTKDEMLPLHKRVAQRLWGFGLEINILSHDNTEKAVERFSELTPTERTLYGIRKEVWMNYLNNEKTSPYLWARKEFCTAASDVMQKELDYVDEGFTINFIETNFAERVALEQYEYGWEESDLTRAIAEHLTDPVMQKIAMEVLSDEQKEEEQEEMPLYEDNPLDLPALDDELTVLAMQPDIKLDENRTLPGVKLLKNEELERWYVINRAGIEGERELNVGDVTNLEELEISPMEFDPNVFRTFYDEQEAQTYFNEKESVMNSVKDNFDRKGIDYEAEVIKSVNTEFEVYKADVLSRSPEDIFYENYKIHVMTELKEVIEEGVLNDYIDKEYYRALYEDRGSILTALYDDFIGDDTYRRLMRILDEHREYDILEFPIFIHYGSSEERVFNPGRKVYRSPLDYFLSGMAYNHSYACNKIFKRCLFDRVKFPCGKVFEDMHVLPMLLMNTKIIATADVGMYYYCWNAGGITATADGGALASLLSAHVGVIRHVDGRLADSPDFVKYYMHVLNIQCDVFRLTGSEIMLPYVDFPFFSSFLNCFSSGKSAL